MRKAERIVNLIILFIGIFILAESLKLLLFSKGIPGPGFLPFLIGVFIIMLALIQIFSAYRNKNKEDDKPNPITRNSLKPVFIFLGSGVVFVLVTPVIGLLIPLGLMSGFTAWAFKAKKRSIILLAIFTPLFTYLIFVLALGVPLPRSLVGL